MLCSPSSMLCIDNNNNKGSQNRNHISNALIESFLTESFQLNCGFKSFEAALLVLRIAKAVDCRLQGLEVEQFFNLLDSIVRKGINSKSFEGRTVISIEGLEGSGKSTLLHNLQKGCPQIKVYNEGTIAIVSRLKELFLGLPQPINQAFEFLCHYITAHDIICTDPTSPDGISNVVFVIEGYYHHHCCSSICDNVSGEADVHHVFSNAFEWPLDLPRPDLVLFLTLPTNIRLKRLQHTMIDSDCHELMMPSRHISCTDVEHRNQSNGKNNKRTSIQQVNRRSSATAINTRVSRVQSRDSKSNVSLSIIP